METRVWDYRKEVKLQNKAELKKQNRTRQIYCHVISSACLFLVIAVMCSINFFMIHAKASSQQEVVVYKYYTSITVEEGDTLWDIAGIYMSDEFSSVKKYIDEVKSINHLTGNKIYAGEELIVPYYSYEYKK